ncbi:MAG TPA: pro-sigmaK processing inhibitor BofA family protein [Methanocorpusculum sp.]|nr:pro-sigmaK processing inhibitor BofA family protein [Methanocorpusculum sp.]
MIDIVSILPTVILIIAAIAIFAVIYYIFKNWVKLLINAAAGVAILLIVSFLGIFPKLGALSLVQIIICAIGGIPGAVLLIVLSLFGIAV